MPKNSEPNDDNYNKSLWAGQLPPHHQPYPHLSWFTSNPCFISIVISKQSQWCPVLFCPQDGSHFLRSPWRHPLQPVVNHVQDCTWHTCFQRCPSAQAVALPPLRFVFLECVCLGVFPGSHLAAECPLGAHFHPKVPFHTWWWHLAQPHWRNLEKELLGGQAWPHFITSIATAVSLHRALWI